MPPTLKTLLHAVWDMGKALWSLLGVPLLVYSLVLVLLTFGLTRWLQSPAGPVVTEAPAKALYLAWLTGAQFVTHRVICGVGFPVFTPNAERHIQLLAEYHFTAYTHPPQTCDDQRMLYETFLAKGDATP